MARILLRTHSLWSRRCFVGALTILLPLAHNLLRHDHDFLSSKDDYPQLHHQPSVRFIPYPHKTLGSGIDLQCQWETRPVAQDNNLSEETSSLDFTQRNAYTEGICIPPSLNDTLHIFSTAEAVECLSSGVQHRDIKLLISGDSYMKQLYIGLVDILLSKSYSYLDYLDPYASLTHGILTTHSQVKVVGTQSNLEFLYSRGISSMKNFCTASSSTNLSKSKLQNLCFLTASKKAVSCSFRSV